MEFQQRNRSVVIIPGGTRKSPGNTTNERTNKRTNDFNTFSAIRQNASNSAKYCICMPIYRRIRLNVKGEHFDVHVTRGNAGKGNERGPGEFARQSTVSYCILLFDTSVCGAATWNDCVFIFSPAFRGAGRNTPGRLMWGRCKEIMEITLTGFPIVCHFGSPFVP